MKKIDTPNSSPVGSPRQSPIGTRAHKASVSSQSTPSEPELHYTEKDAFEVIVPKKNSSKDIKTLANDPHHARYLEKKMKKNPPRLYVRTNKSSIQFHTALADWFINVTVTVRKGKEKTI